MDRIENVNEYHSVVAKGHGMIMDNLNATDNKTGRDNAKTIMLFQIKQAYAIIFHLNPENKEFIEKNLSGIAIENKIFKELNDMKLEEMSVEKLEVFLFSFQTRADLGPVQRFTETAHSWNISRSRLEE